VTAAIRQVDSNHVIILGGAQWDTNFDVFGHPLTRMSCTPFTVTGAPNRTANSAYLIPGRYKVYMTFESKGGPKTSKFVSHALRPE